MSGTFSRAEVDVLAWRNSHILNDQSLSLGLRWTTPDDGSSSIDARDAETAPTKNACDLHKPTRPTDDCDHDRVFGLE